MKFMRKSTVNKFHTVRKSDASMEKHSKRRSITKLFHMKWNKSSESTVGKCTTEAIVESHKLEPDSTRSLVLNVVELLNQFDHLEQSTTQPAKQYEDEDWIKCAILNNKMKRMINGFCNNENKPMEDSRMEAITSDTEKANIGALDDTVDASLLTPANIDVPLLVQKCDEPENEPEMETKYEQTRDLESPVPLHRLSLSSSSSNQSYCSASMATNAYPLSPNPAIDQSMWGYTASPDSYHSEMNISDDYNDQSFDKDECRDKDTANCESKTCDQTTYIQNPAADCHQCDG